jgi:hypothetical protein
MATYTVFTNTSDEDFSYNLTTISSSDYTSDISLGYLKLVAIGSTVTDICDNAFRDTTSLETVTFEAGSLLATIGENAFRDTKLNSITIPNKVTSIGSLAFYWVWYLKTLIFENGSLLETIGKDAFANTDITSITIPNSVTSIGVGVFYNTDLSSVTFEATSSLATIGDNAFQGTISLTSITIPELVTTIGPSTFLDSSLNEATVNYERLGDANFPTALGAGQTIGGKTNVFIIGYNLPITPEYNRENKNKTMGGVNQKTAPGFANNLNMLRNKYRGSYNRGRNTNI